jgi:hypothetical protein
MQEKCLFIGIRFGQAFDLTYMRSANPRSRAAGVTGYALAVHIYF